jgi:hypothetical protein
VGFAQILLDLTASFALLNRVIKHCHHLLETQDVTTARDSFGYSSKVIPMVPTGWQVVALLDDCWPQRNGTSVASDYNFTAQAIQFPGANCGERITVFFYLSVPFVAGERGNKDREINEKADRLKELNLCQSASAPRVSFETTEREAA